MTRDVKVGLVVSCSFLCLVGVVLTTKLREKSQTTADDVNAQVTAADGRHTLPPNDINGPGTGSTSPPATSPSTPPGSSMGTPLLAFNADEEQAKQKAKLKAEEEKRALAASPAAAQPMGGGPSPATPSTTEKPNVAAEPSGLTGVGAAQAKLVPPMPEPPAPLLPINGTKPATAIPASTVVSEPKDKKDLNEGLVPPPSPSEPLGLPGNNGDHSFSRSGIKKEEKRDKQVTLVTTPRSETLSGLSTETVLRHAERVAKVVSESHGSETTGSSPNPLTIVSDPAIASPVATEKEGGEKTGPKSGSIALVSGSAAAAPVAPEPAPLATPPTAPKLDENKGPAAVPLAPPDTTGPKPLIITEPKVNPIPIEKPESAANPPKPEGKDALGKPIGPIPPPTGPLSPPSAEPAPINPTPTPTPLPIQPGKEEGAKPKTGTGLDGSPLITPTPGTPVVAPIQPNKVENSIPKPEPMLVAPAPPAQPTPPIGGIGKLPTDSTPHTPDHGTGESAGVKPTPISPIKPPVAVPSSEVPPPLTGLPVNRSSSDPVPIPPPPKDTPTEAAGDHSRFIPAQNLQPIGNSTAAIPVPTEKLVTPAMQPTIMAPQPIKPVGNPGNNGANISTPAELGLRRDSSMTQPVQPGVLPTEKTTQIQPPQLGAPTESLTRLDATPVKPGFPLPVQRPLDPGTQLAQNTVPIPVSSGPNGALPTNKTTGTAPQVQQVAAQISQPQVLPAQAIRYTERQPVVQAGDTYQSLARFYYGNENYAAALEQHNRTHEEASTDLRDGRLRIGDRVYVPKDKTVLETRYPDKIPGLNPAALGSAPAAFGTPAPAGLVRYQVRGPADYLYGIAQKSLNNGNRWRDIKDLNPNVSPEVPVPVGTVLLLPAGADVSAENRP
jgi:LysM domain